METIFKVGDKVFDIHFGWGEVIEYIDARHFLVRFKNSEISYYEDGSRIPSKTPTLSFTEYKLEGFSQERPVDYNDYIGKWGAFWYDNDNDCLIISKLVDFEDGLFETEKGGRFRNFKPLTEEQIKVLDL